MALHQTRRRFTVAEYHQMARAGILGEDDRVELIEGEILEMTPIGDQHARCVRRLIQRFNRAFGDEALVDVQNPVRLSLDTEPQPDVTLLRYRPDFYPSHPTPQDIFLLVEVADTSADADRRHQTPLYARHGVPEVWLVDLEQQTVTLYQDPTPSGYRAVRVLRPGETLALAAFRDREIAVSDILD